MSNDQRKLDQALNNFEDALITLEDALKSTKSDPLTPTFSANLVDTFESLPPKLHSRDHAERLLSIGISFWNALNSSDGRSWPVHINAILNRTRHFAVDCIHLAHVALNGVSERFKINDLLLMQFYISCGRKYSKLSNDNHSALACYQRAEQLSCHIDGLNTNQPASLPIYVSRPMFELYIGKAECLWADNESNTDKDHHHSLCEELISKAKRFLEVLPNEAEYLASVEFNFGLYAYERRDIDRAVRWLNQSIATREENSDKDMVNRKKQATSKRLVGVCLLALQKYEQSWKMLKQAEALNHEPNGVYLLLKLSIITKKRKSAAELLLKTVENQQLSLTDCIGCTSLFVDANLLQDAKTAYHSLFQRFKQDVDSIVSVIGPKLFETAVSMGDSTEALDVLHSVCQLIEKHDKNSEYLRWATLCLAAGCNCSESSEYYSAAIFLEQALVLGRRVQFVKDNDGGISISASNKNTISNTLTVKQGEIDRQINKSTNIVMMHEGMVHRLLSTYASKYLENSAKTRKDNALGVPGGHGETEMCDNDGDSGSDEDKDRHDKMIKLAIDHAEKALSLEPADFTARLLLFRSHIMAGDSSKAVLDLSNANRDLDSLDVGALIEAACLARDRGYPQSVVTVLKYILTQSETELKNYPKGFYGTTFVSCVGIMKNEIEQLMLSTDKDDDDDSNEAENDATLSKYRRDLVEVYNAGIQGLQMMEIEDAFGGGKEGKDVEDEKLGYLCDVAWNEGRRLNDKDGNLIVGFFNACHALCQFRTLSNDTLRMRLISKVMCACAAIEGDSADYREAYVHLLKARQESDTLKEANQHDNAIIEMRNVMIIVEARCHAASHDLEAFEKSMMNNNDGHIHESMSSSPLLTGITAESLEIVAGVCDSWFDSLNVATSGTDIERVKLEKLRLARLQIGLLDRAIGIRITHNQYSSDIVATMRQIIKIHLRINEASGGALQAFKRAIAYGKEHAASMDRDERQWLISFGWNRGQTLMQVGRRVEAEAWATSTLEIINRGDEHEQFYSVFVNLINGDGDEAK